MSQNQKEPVPLSKKRWPKVIAVIALLVIGFLLALPYAIRYGLERWLVNNGAQSAEIEKVRLNLFTGTAGVNGLQIKLDDNVVLGKDNIHLDFAFNSLCKSMENDKDQGYSVCSRALVRKLAGDFEKNVKNQQKILEDESARKELRAIAETRAENVQKYLLKNFSIDEVRQDEFGHLLLHQLSAVV